MLDMPHSPAREALKFLYGNCPDSSVEVCALPLDKGAPIAEHFESSDVEDAAEWLVDMSERGYRCYFGIQPRSATLVGNAKRASDSDVEQAICIGLDFDDGEALKQANDGLFKVVKPSMIVRTGTKPTNRAWVFWVLDRPSSDTKWFDLARQLARCVGADMASTNPSRIARAPGFYTLPPAHKLERGYQNESATLHYLGDYWDGDELHEKISSFIDAQPAGSRDYNERNPLDRKVGRFSGVIEPLDVDGLKENCKNNRDWNSSAWRLVGYWVRQRLPDSDILTLAESLTAPGYTVDQTRSEIEDMIWRTRERQGVEPLDVDAAPEAKQTKPALPQLPPMQQGLSVKRPGEMMYKGPPVMAVDGLLPMRGTGLLIADSNVGKSFFAINMAIAVGSGTPLLGQNTTRAFCLYVGLEGYSEIEARFLAGFKGMRVDRESCDLAFATGDLNLGDEAEIEGLIELYQAESDGADNGIIVIDTFSMATPGLEENSATDMAAVMRALQYISYRTGSFVLAAHHTAKNSTQMRGSSALRGNVDTVLAMEKDEQGLITLSVDKQRDGQPIPAINMTIKDVELVTPDGEIGEKGYMVLSERQKKRSVKLSSNQRAVYEMMLSMPPGEWQKQRFATVNMPDGVWWISQKECQKEAVNRGISQSESSFRGTITKLVQANIIGKDQDKIWPVEQPEMELENEF